MKKAREGMSMISVGSRLIETNLPTPSAANIIANHHLSDSDHDGIPNQFEVQHNLNPGKALAWEQNIWRRHLETHTTFNVFPSNGYLMVKGQSLPHTSLLLRISDQHQRVTTDANGFFQKQIFLPSDTTANIQASLYYCRKSSVSCQHSRKQPREIDPIMIMQQEVILPNHFIAHQISDITIRKVLPNPSGNDVGNEQIVLSNDTSQSGWLHRGIISNGAQEVVLPPLFFKAYQSKTFGSEYVPTLRNNSGQVTLLQNDRVLSHKHWQNRTQWCLDKHERISSTT